MKKFSLLFTLLFFVCADVFAQQNVAVVIQKITNGKGQVTKAEYDEFWQSIGVTKRADKAKMIDSMRSGFLLTQEYQKEIWVCVEQSWNSRIAVKCEKAQKKMDVMKAAMNKDQIEVIEKMDQNSKRMIQSASKHEDFKIAEGAAPLKLDVQNIRVIRENLERMLKRLEQVLRADYN